MSDLPTPDPAGQEPAPICVWCRQGALGTLLNPGPRGILRPRPDGGYQHDLYETLCLSPGKVARESIVHAIPTLSDALTNLINAPTVVHRRAPSPVRPAPPAPPSAAPPPPAPPAPDSPVQPLKRPTRRRCRPGCTFCADLSTALHAHASQYPDDTRPQVETIAGRMKSGRNEATVRRKRGYHGLPQWYELMDAWQRDGCTVFDGQSCTEPCMVCTDRRGEHVG